MSFAPDADALCPVACVRCLAKMHRTRRCTAASVRSLHTPLPELTRHAGDPEASVRSLSVTVFTSVSSSNPTELAQQEGERVSTFLFLSKTLANVPTTVSPCARVLSYFYKRFSSSLDPNAHACKPSSSGTYETK
jgi:hypothetical protein